MCRTDFCNNVSSCIIIMRRFLEHKFTELIHMLILIVVIKRIKMVIINHNNNYYNDNSNKTFLLKVKHNFYVVISD